MDKKAKKRKFNLLDVIIVLVLAAVLAFAAYKLIPSEAVSGTERAHITFFAEETPGFVLDKLHVGDPVIDADRNVSLGMIESISYEPYIEYAPDAEGRLVANEMEGIYNVSITTYLDAVPSVYGVSLNGVIYGVGHTAAIRAGFAKATVVVSDIVYDNTSAVSVG